MAKDVKFNIRLNIDGKDKLVAVTADVRKLRQTFDEAQSSTQKFRDKLMSINQAVTAVQGIAAAMNGLKGQMESMAATYNAVQQANVQLTTVMRQRMNATDEDVQKINGVIKAQTELGVVSGNVQRMGAQQMATFLNQKNSLSALIPAMNNLIAQQKGLNASQGDAVGIANLMGKAMQGQTSALRRVGITFTDAQERVMKMGTEEERAAMLAQIITDNVGNMNAELGKTDAGKVKRASNYFAGLKVQIGEIASRYLPQITMFAGFGTIITSVTSLGSSVSGLITKIASWTIVQKACTAASVAWNAVGVRMNAVVQLASASFRGAAVSATTMKLAIQGLMCATVIGAALAALGQVIASLMTSADDTAESMKQMGDAAQQSADEAQQAFDGTLKQTYSQLMQQYDALREKWQSLKTAHEKLQWVRNNQQAFQQLGLKVQSVADAESIFKGNTDKVVEAFKRRAKAAAYAAELANLYGQQLQLETRAADIKLSMQVVKQKYYAEGNKDKDPYFYQEVNRKAHDFAVREDKRNGNDGNIDSVLDTIDRIQGKIADVTNSMKQLKADDLVTADDLGAGGGKTGGGRTGGRTGGGKTTPKPEPKQDTRKWSEKSYDERIAALEQDIKNSKNEGLNAILREMVEDLKREKKHLADFVSKAQGEADGQQGSSAAGSLTGSLLPQMPAKIEVPTIDFPDFETEAEKIERYAQALQGLNGIDLTSFDSVRQGLSSIKELTGSTSKGWAAAGASCQALGNAMQQMGADSEAAKAGLVMAAVGNLVLSFAQALASCKTWVEWLAFGISGTAQLVSLVSTVSGFATGGVVGGSSTSGDKLMIGVNSGEMILNRAQQRRLFDIANGAFRLPSTGERRYNMQGVQPAAMATAAARPQTVRLEVRGTKLFGVLENTRRTSGRRYDIT